MAFQLQPGERVDDLLTKGYGLIQSDEVFSFSMDAVLLAHFATVRPGERVIDLGTGNGVIPILLTTRTNQPLSRVVGLELQERLADMASRSVQGNGLDQLIEIFQGDMREAEQIFGWGQFDLVTCNPPYRPHGQGDTSLNEHIRIAKHEVSCTLKEAVQASGKMVKSGGKVAFVHRPDRLTDLIYEMRLEKLEPKRMRLVYPRVNQRPSIVLVEASKNGKPDIRIEPPLIVYGEDGKWTPEVELIYRGERNLHAEKI